MSGKRIKRFTDSKTRKRIKRFRKQESPEYKIDQLWGRKRKLFSTKSLIFIVEDIEYPKLQKEVLKEFLTRENLNFDLFDRMLNVSKEILEKNKRLRAQFFKQCFDICTAINLVELGEVAVSEAIKELFQRIEIGSISNRIALQALIRYFKKTTNEKARMDLWKKIAKLDPNEDDSKELLDLIYDKHAFYRITLKIEKYIRKKAEKKDKKTIARIKELIKQIKIKKG